LKINLKDSSHKNSLFPTRGFLYFFSALFFLLGLATGAFSLQNLKNFKANFDLLLDVESIQLFFEENNLPIIELDISHKNYLKIANKRAQALKHDRLESSDDDFVVAKISHKKNSTDCKVRLKGDLSAHWSGTKWSLRVHTKNDETFLGMKRFSLQDPITRNHTYEWLFLENLKLEDIMAPRYRYVNLKQNGKDRGIFAIEEHFSKEMIENNQRREGIIMCFDEHYMWNLHWNLSWPSTYRTANIDVRNESRVAKHTHLREQQETAVQLLRKFQDRTLSATQVFDEEKTGKFFALSHLWGAEHGLSYPDMNFFFNPVTAKIEPIGMDGKPSQVALSPYNYFCEGEMEDTWVNYALRSPKIAHSYISYLNKFSSSEYILNLKKQLGTDELHLRKLLTSEYFLEDSHSIWNAKKILLENDPWDLLEERSYAIRRGLEDSKIALLFGTESQKDTRGVEITVRNALNQPIEVLGFECEGNSWKARKVIKGKQIEKETLCPNGENIVLPPNKWTRDSPTNDFRFFLSNPTKTNGGRFFLNKSVFASVRILGLDKPVRISVEMDGTIMNTNSLPLSQKGGEITKIFPFIKKSGTKLTIPAGTHFVKKDLFIPYGYNLTVDKGACLKFSQDTTMVSKGAIFINGTVENPVSFTSAKDSWGGVLINSGQSRSVLRFFNFNNACGIGKDAQKDGIERAGWMMTGGITFNNCNVDLLNCNFEDIKSEDALNLIHSDFKMLGCTFRNVKSDAFDGDFVRGLITDCNFEKIGGDAIDLSGSNVVIREVEASSVLDKAISAGEGSSVEIFDSHFHNVGFAIAAKDLSDVKGYKIKVRDVTRSALAAYQKKDVFGPAKIAVTELEMKGTGKRYIAENGSDISLNGLHLKTSKIDVEELYE